MHKKVLFMMVLLLGVSFAAEIVTFDNNWASNPLFNVISETSTGIQVVFSMHEMVIEEQLIDGVAMKSFGVPTVSIPDEGAPNLTGISRYIAIPRGAQAIITILDSRTEVYHNVEVAPAPNIPRDGDDAPLRYVKDMEIYGRNAYYPSSPVRLSKAMEMRGVDIVLLGVMPFQYNPVTKELIVYKDIRVKVDFIGGTGHFGEDRLRSRFWEPILQSHLLNYNSLPHVDFYAPERIQARDGYEYIIIVPDDALFEAWADTIKVWRKLQGISCEVYTLTEIGGSSASAIESFLDDAYNTWDPAPAAFLILSDYPSSGDLYGITSPTYSYFGYTCVTDNKYADVNGDHLPDMHHARMTAQTEVHLTRMVNKVLSYEREPYTAANFYDEPLVACGWQDDRWFQLCSETVRHFFINNFGKDPARQYNNTGSPVPGGPWSTRQGTRPVVQYWYNAGWLPDTLNPYDASWWNNGSAAGVSAAINSGAFLVQHRDHGGETGWSHPSYHNSDLNSLTNTMFTYVFSINCLTGKYNWSSECFTEKFHRIEYGALGVNAASNVSMSFVNDTYVWGIYDCLWSEFDPGYPAFDITGYDNLRPCMAMTSGKHYLRTSWMPDSAGAGAYRECTNHLFHHHGDVFNTLYSEIPQNPTVNHASTLPEGQIYFTVTADDSSVIALTVDGEIIGVAEGTGSPVNITISPQVEGDTVLVTVTKANYYRYTADVPVGSGGTTVPNIILVGIEVVGGNNNGMLDPGESAGIVCTIANTGSDSATNSTGTLRTTDTYITITDSTTDYGTLQPGDTVDNSSDPFEVTVSSSCPVGYDVDFDLYIVCAESSWTKNFTLTVGILGLDYATHDCGNVRLTVTRYGAIGYMGAGLAGSGFWYPMSNGSHLYYGGFAAGTDANYCVDRYMEQGGNDDTDWETTTIPDGMVRMFEPGPNNIDEYATARYDDSGHPSPKDLICAQHSWAWDDAGANDFVIMKFTLHNEGTTTISDLYAAVFMDWDVGDYANNQGSSDASRNLTWMYENTPYVGVAILDPPRSTPAVNLALIDHDLYVYPDTGLPDNIQIQFMDGTIQNPSSNRPDDWSTCNSAGPFTLGSGDTAIAAFVIIGGDNLGDLQANADTAYNRYWNWPGVEEMPSPALVTDIKVYPVISRGRPYTLQYGFVSETSVRIKVYDALGRLVKNKNYGMLNGSGDLLLNLKSLAQGIYFVKVEAGNKTSTSKIIWLK